MIMKEYKVKGFLVDIPKQTIFPSEVTIEGNRIAHIDRIDHSICPNHFLLPGFVDAHIHIESSMLVPVAFGNIAIKHGTVATISDPHEIANVLGVKGVEYMVANGLKSPLKFTFGAPSCVPATTFESAGAEITVSDIEYLFDEVGLTYLSEMMNYPGVLYKHPDVLAKIQVAKSRGLPIDGHAPGLRGDQAAIYVKSGISTDHECFYLEEALEKLKLGMKIIIREGSAAKNYSALHPLIKDHSDFLMFCSDDKHPDDLLLGHINQLVKRAVEDGYNLFDVLKIACINPVRHYSMDVGLLNKGDKADFIIVKDLDSFQVIDVWIEGTPIVRDGISEDILDQPLIVNNFNTSFITVDQLQFSVEVGDQLRVIKAIDGELVTEEVIYEVSNSCSNFQSDISSDILKIVVHNRYKVTEPAIAYIQGFGLRYGAIASSVAHDCHNIVAVGVDDASIALAINKLVESKGGIVVVSEDAIQHLPLPIAGIISDQDAQTVGHRYAALDASAKANGSQLKAPFMTLSFMALLVIPQLKLSDFGLFDGHKFEFASVKV